MQILHYDNGDILAIGEITEQDGIFTVLNDPFDVPEYTLSGFTINTNLVELTAELPVNFNKFQYKFIDNQFTTGE